MPDLDSDPGAAVVSTRGVHRWDSGHPWIFRSDVIKAPTAEAGSVRVYDNRRRPLGWALWSPASEISLRLLDTDPSATIDERWWAEHIARAVRRRDSLREEATAYRLIHGEGDALPSLVCDRYDRYGSGQI